MAKSVYIHIPFCKSKCKYCSFISFCNIENIRVYLSSLMKEIKFSYKGEQLKTLYFGGGTPSLLSAEQLEKIIKIFNLDKDTEITLEVNPDDASLEYLSALKQIGINRLSIGSQTFNDEILNSIGRRHNSKQTINAVKMAKQVGFGNISLDLIYGLPGQTIDILKKDLEIISTLGVQHISTYGLKIEEDSYWGKFPPENLPDDDMQADMYLEVNDYLESKGYKRYEISNFALNNYESKHNLNYWNNDEYYGFGVAAHGYNDGIRYSNTCSFKNYLHNPLQHSEEHVQTKIEKLEEEIFLGFRKESGVNVSRIKDRYDIDFEIKYKEILNKFSPKYIKKTPQGYKLTLEGVLLSNNILAEFLE
ncbi:MAG: radical SAM family heme chaperone HemW [Cyanobacteria bacterium SIG31]|nr:radical SAM family heme chaperone HemW [Cyanobacteria bacterium SIG31]